MKTKLLAITVAALLLAGCTSTGESETTAVSKARAEAAYLEQLLDAIPGNARATTAQWLDVGTAVCDAYGEGYTPNQVVDSMQGSNVSAEEAAAIVVIAADTLCPEYG